MFIKSFSLLGVAVFAIGAAATSLAQTSTPVATAADAPAPLDEIVITARRRTERLNDVPIAASVESGADLRERGTLTNTQAALEGIAGLNFNSAASPSLSEVTIRGSGAALTATGGDSGIGIYRNGLFSEGGLYYGHNLSRADFFDVERIEVLRGTQGALYGRDAVGGSINVISARPSFDNSGRVDLDYGASVDAIDGQLVLNNKLTDNIAVRVGANIVDQQGGFLLDRTPGNDKYLDSDHGGVVRGQIRFKNDSLDVNLLLERQNEHSPSDAPGLFYPAHAPQSIAGGFASGFANPQYERDQTLNPTDINNVTNAILNLNYQLSFATLSFNSSYRDLYARTVADVDGFTTASLADAVAIPGNTGITASGPIDVNQNLFIKAQTAAYDNEMHLAGGDGPFTWLVGLEYLNLESDATVLQTHLTPQAPLISAISQEHWVSWAGFTSLGYDFIPKVLNLTADLRYTDDKKDQNRFNNLTGAYVLKPTTYKQDNTSYDITLGYHPWTDILAYAKVGTGYRVGGANAIPIIPSPPAPVQGNLLYNDETSLDYEIGIKGNPTKNTYLGIAAYHVRTDGIIVSESDGCTIALCHGIFPNFLTNGGVGESWGVEVEGKDHFELLGGHAVLGATMSRQTGTINSGPFNGFRVPQEPNWIGSVDFDFSHVLRNQVQGFIHVNDRAQSGGTQDVSTPNYDLDNRNVFNLRFGLRQGGWELAGYVNNLFDDKYRDARTVTTNLWDLNLRSAGLQLRYAW
jgi:iron complex outermembrane receptor protein